MSANGYSEGESDELSLVVGAGDHADHAGCHRHVSPSASRRSTGVRRHVARRMDRRFSAGWVDNTGYPRCADSPGVVIDDGELAWQLRAAHAAFACKTTKLEREERLLRLGLVAALVAAVAWALTGIFIRRSEQVIRPEPKAG